MLRWPDDILIPFLAVEVVTKMDELYNRNLLEKAIVLTGFGNLSSLFDHKLSLGAS